MAVLIGETISRFYDGELFKFERVAKGEWRQISGSKCIPWCIREEIEKLDKPRLPKYVHKSEW